jgi:hypothetical protein
MMDFIKFEKKGLKGECWKTHSMIGEALNGYLKEQVTPVFCPKEVMEVIDKRMEEIYTMGFEEAITQIRDSIVVIKYKEKKSDDQEGN